jgi:uncharacterized repeat protein (TIGR01451 family)
MKEKYLKLPKSIFYRNFLVLLLISTSGLFSAITAQITGTVFRDFNANGVKDNSATYNEIGVGGVTVKCVGTTGTGTTTTSTATATLGQYSLTGCTGATRVEFTWTQADDYSGAVGTGSNTSVQFVTATASNVNFGINYPANYCQANPDMVTPIYVNGRVSGAEAFYKFPSSSVGTTSNNTELAQYQQIGTTWGVAYDRDNQIIYTSAFLKRHTSLVDNDGNGTEDIGAIYKMSPTGSPSLWLNIATLAGVDVGLSVMPTIATRALPTTRGGPSHDSAAFDLIGKIGIGDIDISDDNKQLFVVSLYDRKVYTIDIATKTLVGSGIAVPTGVCTGGELRPFGLKYHRGKIYVGTVCDAQSSQNEANIKAILYRIDGTTFTNILNIPLNYVKGIAINESTWPTPPAPPNKWNPWKTDFTAIQDFWSYPQAIFADIEFDVNEDVMLVFVDRFGHQMGTFNYGIDPADTNTITGVSSGDILRATYTGTGYVLENNASVGGLTSAGAGNNQGPGGGEFYFEDQYSDYHNETVTGGAAFKAGTNQVAVNSFDPFDGIVYATGVNWMNSTTGASDKRYQINVMGEVAGSFGKTNGLGDLELLCNPAPIEIGNRVWLDSDSDGVQDPGEAGISGVQVQLLKGVTVISTVTTDTNGNYLFSSATGADATGKDYGITQLASNMGYTVRFPTTTTVSGTSYNLTTANSATGTDLIDSDAPATGDVSVLATDIPVSGANNHTFDVGYSAVTCTQPTFTISAVQPTCASPTGSISIGTITGPDSYTFNYDDMGTYVAGVLGVNGTATNGASVASGLSAGTYTVQLFKSTDNTCISNPNQTVTLTAATGCGGGGQPDLEITKVADKATVVSGNTITYTITLKNVGTADATGVKVKDAIPAGLTLSLATPSQGTYASGIWDVGTVAVGATLTLTITVTVD